MNELLKLSGKGFSQSARNTGGPASLTSEIINIEKSNKLLNNLKKIATFWEKKEEPNLGVFVSVKYVRIVPKSKRINTLFKDGSISSNDRIVGIKLNDDKNKTIITYHMELSALCNAIKELELMINLYNRSFNTHTMTAGEYNNKNTFNKVDFKTINKTTFRGLLYDSCFVDEFFVQNGDFKDANDSLVTFYKIDDNNKAVLKGILNKIDVKINDESFLDDTTILLQREDVQKVKDEVPYLVSMSVVDINTLSGYEQNDGNTGVMANIGSPTDEPTIGVLDTLFDTRVFFSPWVEYQKKIPDDIPVSQDDYRHGTAVTSLIVAAQLFNPDLDDGLGYFRVRHFGISLAKGYTSFSIIKSIEKIVADNSDIKVWNLSLGSNSEISENFISVEASKIDEIQEEYDVIFVIAGTNKQINKQTRKIGAPADSVNSLVVNSVSFNNEPASFSRVGPVLSFFTKPDVAYYGGGNGDFVNVMEPNGCVKRAGTSFAAPLISRKLAFLIGVMHFNREVAKAILIDSAVKWDGPKDLKTSHLIGNGVVPIKIDDIIKTNNDEIKFVVSDTSEKWDTYNYNFPVPLNGDGDFPYIAKVVMVYFPKTKRSQGIEYTNTELTLQFGRLDGKKVRSIDDDKQNDDDPAYLKEKKVRDCFRKWDNVKIIREKNSLRKRNKSRLTKDTDMWGMSIKTTERLSNNDGRGLNFGAVVTLKALDSKNRIDQFIQNCELRGWLVERASVENYIILHNQSEQTIDWQ
ncbi:S8 family peptidase [Levilactobacillus brevis]|uniref:S8 family peptidase n=1 Tax=Levilactobacillus brevis TaxID=1580 RepID=UPI001BA7AE32|nr:S8 family peptidase [Levilactobacillus brevis]MBS1012485.1 S8 family peptidase [Levilactobacillus brevis]